MAKKKTKPKTADAPADSPAKSNVPDFEDVREKRAFLAHMRHELRTPINGIIGYSELMLEDAEDNEDLAELAPDLEKILTAGRELLDQVNDLLEASKLEAREDLDVEELGGAIRFALRTPISAVMGYSELLIDEAEEMDLADIIPDLQRIYSCGQRLLDLIGNILDFAQGAETQIETDDVGVSAMAHDAIASIKPLARQHGKLPEEERGCVLVVDDNEINRDLLSRQLGRRGHAVVEAEDGLEAMELLEKQEFDLVLLDVMMPKMNGFEVLQRVKASDKLRHLPIVMISALHETDSAVRCIEAGAEDYLPKPFNPVLLHARIGACLEKKKLRDREQAFLRNLQLEWEKSKRLEDNLRQVVQQSLQRPPEEMLGESLNILVGIAGAALGAILGEDGPSLSFAYASIPELIGQHVSPDSIAGETAAKNVISYSKAAEEEWCGDVIKQGAAKKAKYLLSIPIPCILSRGQEERTSARSAGVLQLLFNTNVLPHLATDKKALEFATDLGGGYDSENRLLQELVMILPILSLGMEITNIRQTSYQAIHELKNKLISGKSWLNCLKEDIEGLEPDVLEDEDVVEDFDLAFDSLESGSKLAVSYLQFSKIYNPQFEECQLNDVLAETANDIKALAQELGSNGSFNVETDFDDAVPLRQLDPAQLKMAFFNLGKNAAEALIEHGVTEPKITLVSRFDNDGIMVEITDNGNGMPPEISENLFVAFKTKKEGGTGLGLTIAKKILDIHGGAIRCESGPQGTRFAINI